MDRKHVLFEGPEVDRIWTLAVGGAVVNEMRRLLGTLRDELRVAHGRLDAAPGWPDPEPLSPTVQDLAWAAASLTPPGTTWRRLDGPVPAGFERLGAGAGSTLYVRKGPNGVVDAYALEWSEGGPHP